MNESGLLARLKNGDDSAFREVIERHEGRVAATVTGILGSGPDVEDVGQETFVRFFRSLARFRGDSTMATYLTRIAVNLSLNELRRRRRFDRFPETDLEDPSAGSTARSSSRGAEEARVVIRRGLEKLEPKFRTVIVLRLIDGFSTRETARILGLPHGTVLSRLARGQAKLKEAVGGSAPASERTG